MVVELLGMSERRGCGSGHDGRERRRRSLLGELGEEARGRRGEQRVRGEAEGAAGRLQTWDQGEGRASGAKQEVAVAARASTRTCSYWQEEDDAAGWCAGLSTVLGHSWAD